MLHSIRSPRSTISGGQGLGRSTDQRIYLGGDLQFSLHVCVSMQRIIRVCLQRSDTLLCILPAGLLYCRFQRHLKSNSARSACPKSSDVQTSLSYTVRSRSVR